MTRSAALDPAEILSAVPGRGKPRIVLATMVKAWPRPVKTRELIKVLYGDRRSGPKWLAQAIADPIQDLRPRLKPLGWTIPHGGSVRGYRLERIA